METRKSLKYKKCVLVKTAYNSCFGRSFWEKTILLRKLSQNNINIYLRDNVFMIDNG